MVGNHSITLLCTQCSRPFTRFVSNIRVGHHPFCSKVCQNTFQHVQGLFHRLLVPCSQCATRLTRMPSRRTKTTLYFCHSGCRETYCRDIPARFWEKVAIGQFDDCWPWCAAIDRETGYGAFSFSKSARLFLPFEKKGNAIAAHRVAFFLHTGSINPALNICHTCDNRPCCNYDHLFEGTQADNMHDMHDKGRGARGETHGMAKISEAVAKEVSCLRNTGMSGIAVGRRLGLEPAHVSMIYTGRIWKHARKS